MYSLLYSGGFKGGCEGTAVIIDNLLEIASSSLQLYLLTSFNWLEASQPSFSSLETSEVACGALSEALGCGDLSTHLLGG